MVWSKMTCPKKNRCSSYDPTHTRPRTVVAFLFGVGTTEYNISKDHHQIFRPTVPSMTASKLFERINTCALAMRRVPGDEDESHESAYNHVMRSMPRGMKMPKYEKTKLTKACMEYIRGAFAKREIPDRKLKIAMCVVVSIASGQAEDGLTKAICDRFRSLDDYDHRAMSGVFDLSILNDRALALLNKVIILKTKNVRRNFQHEFRVEFVLTFFGMLESALRRVEALNDLGYVIHATPSDMEKARETLAKPVSLIATRCGPCFNLEAVKNARELICSR
ncbi:unnamed protein product [Pylaiella littoralis]